MAVLLVLPAIVYAEEVVPEEYTVVDTIFNFVKRYSHFAVDDAKAIDNVTKAVLKENPQAMETILKGFMDTLDEHSVYYTKEEFDNFNNYIESGFAGIGVTYLRENGQMVVTDTVENSPAQKAGIQAGDIIAEVDGVSLYDCDTDYAASLIRGEEGSSVLLKIKRGEEHFEVTLIRASLHDITVNYSMLEGDIAYFSISMFSSETSKEFEKAYNELKKENPKGYIVDLRYNSGGVTDEALNCLSYFLPAKAVTMKYYNQDQAPVIYYNQKAGKKENLAVLVNEYTASASEIFSAAIKDNNAGVIVGTRTYGKGTAQTTIGLGEYGGLKLTVAEFKSPNGNTINQVGITPDISIKNMPRKAEAADFQSLAYDKIYEQGDSGEEVYAIKQRLSATGHFNGTMDTYFDASLTEAVKKVQKEAGLFVYGVADITTQTIINNLALEAEITVDSQFDAAYEHVKSNIKEVK